MKTNMLSCYGAGLVLMLASGHVLAEQKSYLGIGGVQVSPDASYAYAGAIVPFDGATVGQGPYYKAIVSWLGYQYDTTQNNQEVEIRGRAPGFEAGFGYAWTGPSYGVDLSAAIGYRNIDVSPIVPEEERTGSVFTFNPQVQARYQFTESFDTDVIASYAFGQRSSFSRLRLGWKPSGQWRTGVEGIWQEGRNYQLKQYGLFATRFFENGLAVELSGGQTEARDDSKSGYIGLAVSRVF